MYNNTWIHLWPTKAHQGYKHTPQTSTVALSLTAISKGANFRSVKNKTSSKRLFYICIFPTSLTSLRKYRRGKRDKDSKYIPLFLVMFLDYSKNKQETDYRYTYLDANSSGRIIAQMVRYKIQQTRLPGTRYTPTLPASYACPVLGMSLACSPHLPDGCKNVTQQHSRICLF